jgi:hypothetical protein
MLAAKLTLAVAPAAARDDRGYALVHAAAVYGDGGAKAAADEGDSQRIDFGASRHIR